ncbi:MAG: tetratricopeptide repeat protein [Chloroflexota bacterium]|nr:tetratricopeptide repeat protein [Chloroflexota bacterium]
MAQAKQPVEVFCCYAHEDEIWLRKLETHLSLLKRQGLLSLWHDRLILPGTDWRQAIDTHLETASVILLLVSADFLASDYCYGAEMKYALEQQQRGKAQVIPILIRQVDWKHAPFAYLHALPTNAKPLATWVDEDTALAEVTAGLRSIIEEMPRLTPRASHAALTPVWNVPHMRNPHFTGRDELLDRLHQHFMQMEQNAPAKTRRAALTQPQAIKGLGGIGKTQIVVEYAYRSRDLDRYTHTLWINAASEEALIASFVTIADALPAFTMTDETDQRKLVEAVKRWLEQCEQRWLLIFDNADDLPLVQAYLPQRGNGSILLTTRASAVGSLTTSIEVEKMGLMEGTHLLLRRAQRFDQASDEEINEATNVVIALDHFPLALDQAGAYIEETKCGFVEYLQIYQNRRKALLARRGLQSTNYPDSVATTWSLSFQKIERANPAAAELLHLCAFLAPDQIPEELIRDAADQWSSPLQQAAADLFAFNQMIADLLKFSLIERLAETRTLRIHRLVQAVQMDAMEAEAQCQWAERVVRAVNVVFPECPQDIATWPRCLRYLDQAQACNTLIEQYRLSLLEAADLLNRTGLYLDNHALYTIAEPLYQRALKIREQQLGPQHFDTAQSLSNLATLYQYQGEYAEAEPLYRRVLEVYKQGLGPQHSRVQIIRKNYGILLEAMGRVEVKNHEERA